MIEEDPLDKGIEQANIVRERIKQAIIDLDSALDKISTAEDDKPSTTDTIDEWTDPTSLLEDNSESGTGPGRALSSHI